MIQEASSEQKLRESARFARLQALFQDAMNLPQQERRPLIESACGGDTALLADIVGMLDEDDGPSLLDQDVGTLAHCILTSEEERVAGAQVGCYRLIRMLGEGGMGTVYLAEREDVGNPVAIKFLRDAWLSPARRQRFLSEQRLLAPLNHPSIARFYDAGTLENGVPWFAMEYVEGVSVTEYCRRRQCTLDQRLCLFRAICAAVQYAHEHAVVHRDLKPSNILVKADGTVRLLDFGIAKQISDFSEPVDQTQTLRMMTPAYAAPEQIRGEPVGVFTDVYSLGVILYELLTGGLPFRLSHRSVGEAERLIAEAKPETPSVAARPSPPFEASRAKWADLDVLCLTAIDKDPQRRYRSAEALGRDVDRYLHDEPLDARADRTAYKVRKFVRRNQRPVIATTAVLLMGVALVTFFLIRLTRARNEALAQAARSDRIKEFMQHLFDSDAQSGPSVELRAVDVLERGAQETRRLDKEPRVQGELLQILGGLYEKLGKFAQAQTFLDSALSVRSSAFGKQSKEAAETLVSLGAVRREQGKYTEALQLIRRGLAMDARLLGPGDFALGSARMELGRILVSSGDYKEALKVLSEAVQSLSRPRAPPSDLFLALDALGTAYLENGQFALAQSSFEKALTVGQRIYKPSNPLLAEEMVNLGSVQFSQQHFSLAEKYYRSGLEATRAWYGPNHVLVASEYRLLGQALLQLGRNPEAEVFLRQALSLHEKLFGTLHGDAIQDLNALAVAAQRDGNLDEAEDYLNRLLRIEDTLNGGKDAIAAMAMNNLADVKREQKQYVRAEELSRQALAIVGKVLPPNHLYAGVILLGLGKTLLHEKRFRDAEPYLENSYAVLGQQGNPSLGTLQKARMALAEDYLALGKSTEARRLETESDVWSKR